MKKIITIVGARPQFIKAAALSRVLKRDYHQSIGEILLHTGQHYDFSMSEVFFQELGIASPKYNLNIGSSSHGSQTGNMLEQIENILLQEKPDMVIVYGDTNSTLAGALAASKLQIPVAHIEAGLRSYNKSMPEEINRISTDHISTLLFCPTPTAIQNLAKEGLVMGHSGSFNIDSPMVDLCGDIMYDSTLHYAEIAHVQLPGITKDDKYIVCTIHREANVRQASRLNSILRSLLAVSERLSIKILLPLHPRTRQAIEKLPDPLLIKNLTDEKLIVLSEPLSYLQMCTALKNCSLVITDSGGVQKEAYFYKKPSVILRAETEWVEIPEQGCSLLADADTDKIIAGVLTLLNDETLNFPPLFGNGKTAEKICHGINTFLNPN